MKKRRREGPQSRKRGTKNGRRKGREGPEKTQKKRLCSWEIYMLFSGLIIYSLKLERETSKVHTRKWRSFIILTRWEIRSLKKIKKYGFQYKMHTKRLQTRLKESAMILVCPSMIAFPVRKTLLESLKLISMRCLIPYSRETRSLQRKSQCQTQETVRLQQIKSTSFTSIGTTSSRGATSLNLMSTILARHRIDMNVAIWRRRIREKGQSIKRRREHV